MSNPSPFLRYQDKNGDFLIDDCEVELPGPIEKVCLECKPNPKALVENWKNNLGFPFLNEKLCLYQVGVKTPHTDTGGEQGLIARFESYKEDAIELFLDEYEKANNFENLDALRQGIFYNSEKDFELEARANSTLSLLFSVPFEVIENLSPADDEDEEDEREPVEVTYLATELPILFTRVRKGFNLYQRYVQYHSIVNSSTLMFDETRSVFDFGKYGDSGFGATSQMAKVLNELDRFLNNRGFNIAGAGTFGFGKDRVVKLTVGFDTEYKLKKLAVYSIGCREKPRIFKGRKIAALNRTDIFKDRTAMAYFASLSDIETDLTARRALNFIDLIEKYTYPSVSFFDNAEIADNDASCVGETIRNTVQGIGQDILDEALSIGDVIAYKFHENNCRTNEEESELLQQFTQEYKPPEELALIGASKKKRKKNEKEGKTSKKGVLGKESRQAMKAVALEQALETLETNPNIYVQLCGQMLAGTLGANPNFNTRDLWDYNFNQLKLCGLFDFLLDALGCLWGGLDLEQALLIAITSALKAMGLENFGNLFAGLPPEQQAELDALVQRKLQEAQQSRDTRQSARPTTVGGPPQQGNDSVNVPEEGGFFAGSLGEISFVKPFEDPVLLEQEKAARTAGPYEGTTVSKGMYEAESKNYGIRPRIGTTYNSGAETAGLNNISGNQTPTQDAVKSLSKRAQQQFSPDVIMEAYILALVEYYSGRLLDLVDLLNNFPGAEIISKFLATFDCPRPPLFTPSVMDFIKDIELPFCRNIGDIALPKLFIPKFSLADLFKLLVQAIIEAIIETVIKILLKLFVKICEILGEAICKALETAGNIIGGLPGLISGNTTISDIVRESICGEGASQEDVDNSIASLYQTLGGAGGNLANKDRVLAFNEAIASSSTRQEIIDASLGNPSQQFLNAVDTIIEYQFPEFREAMSNKDAIASFYTNFGNLLPPELKSQLSDLANQTYEELQLPANPTLCATPDQLEEFCSLRSQILEGRATDAQIAELCKIPTDDFQSLNDILQDGIPATIMNNLPPLQSDPNCDNGLFPYEPEALQQDAAEGLSADLENLKIAYAYDMLGNGPGEKNWGYVNMVLSDTMARPFTNHARLVNRFSLFGAKKYVDFYVSSSAANDDEAVNYANLSKQRGAFPVYIGEWQADYWNLTNGQLLVQDPLNYLDDEKSVFIKTDDDVTALPDFGYNYKIEPTNDGYYLIKQRRKIRPELTLEYRNNRAGNGAEDGAVESMSLGTRLQFFFGEIFDGKNIKDSNVRVEITRRINASNFASDTDAATAAQNSEPDSQQSNTPPPPEFPILESKKYEFLGIDAGIDELLEQARRDSRDNDKFSNFEDAFQYEAAPGEQLGAAPITLLLSELLDIQPSQARTYWSSVVASMVSNFGNKIFNYDGENANSSFFYGAKPDTLTSELAEYGVEQNGVWTQYSKATVDGTPGGEPLTNDDAILGISRDQYENGDDARIIYLDPGQFGGKYTNPKVYVKPIDTDGILGLVNVMFPELSPCKPYRTDLVDFADIGAKISNSYNNYPDDPRLAGDPDCIVERPFDRVLDRIAKAGIEGTISAACRIYASMHFLKTINTFSVFKPDFETNLSTTFASYILEDMEENMKEQQGLFAEVLNPFKDDEFWYAFLEQSVQIYYEKIQSGAIIEVPMDVERALERIAIAQNRYDYPDRKDLRNAKKLGEAPALQGLNQFREDKNLAAVKSVEDDCKIVLKEFMKEEVNFIANVFYQNMVAEGLIDRDNYVSNIHYHILTELTDGSQLTLNQQLRETVTSIPTGSNQYTDGNALALEDGTPYVGYYHTHVDDEGDLIYMVGEIHSSEPHDILRPFANEVSVNMGDINGIFSDPTKPFRIRKYIRRNLGEPEDYSQSLIDSIREAGGDSLVSEIYPGTLEYVYDAGSRESIQSRTTSVRQEAAEEGRTASLEEVRVARTGEGRPIVGLKGELGLRYGLELSTSAGQVIARSEIDVLDLPLRNLKPLEGGSKELLCLVNKLIDDPHYKLFMEYAIPVKQILSALAIYNNVSYLDSIGEIASGQKSGGDVNKKPGSSIGENGEATNPIKGWLPFEERGGFSPFVLTWDEWSKETLRKSDTVLKKMFKSYYYSREFGKQERPDATGAQVLLRDLKEKFKFAPGDRAVPWWHRRTSNPFNAKEELCERKE